MRRQVAGGGLQLSPGPPANLGKAWVLDCERNIQIANKHLHDEETNSDPNISKHQTSPNYPSWLVHKSDAKTALTIFSNFMQLPIPTNNVLNYPTPY